LTGLVRVSVRFILSIEVSEAWQTQQNVKGMGGKRGGGVGPCKSATATVVQR